MLTSHIAFPKETIRVTVVNPEAMVTSERTTRDDFARFRQDWNRMAQDYHAAPPLWTGENIKVAQRLLQKHGLDRLWITARLYWQMYSDPIYRTEAQHHMVVFAHAVPIILAETSDETTTRKAPNVFDL